VTQLPSDIFSIVVPVAIVLLSLSVHEAAHAWSADRLGDPTARLLGRVSLNPVVHIDPIGTIVLPLIAAVSNFPIIGWAKPVPVNISQLRHGRTDFMLVAAAGPISNILLAIAAAVAAQIVPSAGGMPSPYLEPENFLIVAGSINIFLAVFNLVPVPPLDGGNVLAGLLPPSAAAAFDNMRPCGFIILYALMFTGMLSEIILPPARFLIGMLFP
jgi:Zn-dependent protease